MARCIEWERTEERSGGLRERDHTKRHADVALCVNNEATG